MVDLSMRYNVNQYAKEALYGLPIAVFDFETTGVDTNTCRAVEMAVVHLELGKGNAKAVYTQRFNPGVPIPEGASNIHGIKDEDVLDKPTFIECWTEIEDLFKGRVLAAYNLSFDWSLLNQEYRRQSIWQPTYNPHLIYGEQMFGICGLVMARSIDKMRGKGVHKLNAVCKRRGIELDNAHEASSDALASAQLIECLMGEVRQKRGEKFPTFRDFWGWQKIQAIQQEANLRQWLLSKDIENDVWPWTDY